MTGDPTLLAAVALLRARDAEIASLRETVAVQAVQVRWLKQLLAQQDDEIDARERTINELFLAGIDSPEGE